MTSQQNEILETFCCNILRHHPDALVSVGVASAPPAAAQDGISPVTNIELRYGADHSEVTVSWDPVPRATHYRIGYVNMEVDYHLATAGCTKEWIEAFVYVDVNALNIPVNNGKAEYTVRRIDPGAGRQARLHCADQQQLLR